MTTDLKAFQKVITDLTPIYEMAKTLRDSPQTEQERIHTIKNLCDQLSLLADGLIIYVDVLKTLHVSNPLEDFMKDLHAGQGKGSL